MIVFRIRDLAEKKGLKTAYQFQMAMNIPPSTASRWWKNSQMKNIEAATLERLCEFFECEPGDIIVRVMDDKPSRPKGRKQAAHS